MERIEMIQVEMFPANRGDCFLITLVEDDYRILIDGGISQTYENYLKPRLLQLAEEGKVIDLLIVTHVDDDHIGGIIALLKENGTSTQAKVIPIKEVWHNSYRHLSLEKGSKAGFREEKILKDIISNRSIREQKEKETGEKQISAIRGTTLAGLLYKGGYCWNRTFHEGAVCLDMLKEIQITENATIKLLSPTKESIDKLGKYWAGELKKSKYDFCFSTEAYFDDAFEYYFRFLRESPFSEVEIASSVVKEETLKQMIEKEMPRDVSPTNNSSIAFLLTYMGKKMLFMGDLCVDCLGNEEQEKLDLIKVPHHGSGRNISMDFLKKYRAHYYLISTDGSIHRHPDAAVIAKIIAVNCEERKQIFFNYSHEKLTRFCSKEMEEKYQCELIFPEETDKVIVCI